MNFDEIVKDKEYRQRVIKFFRLPMRLTVTYEKFMSDMDFISFHNPELYSKIIELTESDFDKLCFSQDTEKPDFSLEAELTPIVEEFKENPNFKKFMLINYGEKFKQDFAFEKSKVSDFYSKNNDGKNFLSIDLVSANWQTLQNIIGFEESYEEFISKRIDLDIPKHSKTVRTKIAGMLCAKNIMDYNMYLLISNRIGILNSLFKHTGVNLLDKKPDFIYADEFITELSEEQLKLLHSLDLEEVENKIYIDSGIKIHLRPFKLKWMNVDKACVKFHKNNFEIINISKDVLLLIEKLISGYEINEVDFEKINLKGLSKDEFLNDLIEKISSLK